MNDRPQTSVITLNGCRRERSLRCFLLRSVLVALARLFLLRDRLARREIVDKSLNVYRLDVFQLHMTKRGHDHRCYDTLVLYVRCLRYTTLIVNDKYKYLFSVCSSIPSFKSRIDFSP